MTDWWQRLPTDLPLALCAAFTSTTVLASWGGLSVGNDPWLSQLLLGTVLVAVLGSALRGFGVPMLLVPVIQVTAVGAWISLSLSGSPIPWGSDWAALGRDVDAAITTAQRFLAPVPENVAPLDALLLPAGMGLALLVDLVAVTLRRVSLSGLVLLAAYTVPVSLLRVGGVPWWVFALSALGFLVMLHLQECERLLRWGRPGAPGTGAAQVTSQAFRTTMVTAAASSIALAVLLAALTPRLDLGWLGGGRGSGGGDIQVTNPLVDLKRDLTRGTDRRLLRVSTDDPDPSYVRMTALTRFTGDQWSPGDRSIPRDQDGVGSLPPLPGVDPDLPRTEYEWSFEATDALQATWLPLPENVREVDAPGPWRYDDTTRDFTSTAGEGQTTSGTSWTAVGATLVYDPDRMARSGSSLGDVSTDYIDLPDDFPPAVRELARDVTAAGSSKFEKAILLQEWFRTDGGFEYTLEVAPGSGSDDLVAFLRDDERGRRGYCEQFAASMAAMGRALNIPSRVAIGFLKPEQVGDQWEFSSHDLHAWPELYIAGSGWVRFEPTPPARASAVPAYTNFTSEVPEDVGSAAASPGIDPSADVPNDAAGAPGQELDPGQGATDESAGTGDVWLGRLLAVAGLVGLMVALALLPWLVRGRRKRRRAADPHAEAAWAELRDEAVDLGLPWPEGTTPRATAILMADHFGDGSGDQERPRHAAALAPDAVQALQRISLVVERDRYARPGSGRHRVAWADVRTCGEAWKHGAPGRVRRRAAWWPRSVFRRDRSGASAENGPVAERSGTVDRVG